MYVLIILCMLVMEIICNLAEFLLGFVMFSIWQKYIYVEFLSTPIYKEFDYWDILGCIGGLLFMCVIRVTFSIGG